MYTLPKVGFSVGLFFVFGENIAVGEHPLFSEVQGDMQVDTELM
jgi:hypothetical protein